MKIQSIKKVILAVLLGAFSSVQTGLWDYTKSFAGFIAQDLALQKAFAHTAQPLGNPVITATVRRQYGKAITQYLKPLAAGVATLAIAKHIDSTNASIVTRSCQPVLETVGKMLITYPVTTITKALISYPYFEPYEQKSLQEICCRYIASLGIGVSTLQLTKFLSKGSIMGLLRMIIESSAYSTAIAYPTTLLINKTLDITDPLLLYLESMLLNSVILSNL